jgi:outer membrane protein TolC
VLLANGLHPAATCCNPYIFGVIAHKEQQTKISFEKTNLKLRNSLLTLRKLLIFTGLGASFAAGQSMPNAPSASGLPASNSFNLGQYTGSVPEGKATGQVLQLSFLDAMERGLRNNLGLLIQSDNTLNARGEKWKELSNLLPNVSASVTQSAEQIDLAALGFRIKAPGFPSVIGPIGVFQSGIYLQQTVFDLHQFDKTRSARANEEVAKLNFKDARDLVVLATLNAYLQSVSYEATVETSQADVDTAQALYDKAADQQKAGVSPAIDTLRARVELQTRQQRLIAAKNNFAKQKLTLARVIGLPSGQEFELTDKAPYSPLTPDTLDQALQRAYTSRSDYLAAVQQLRAAQLARRAATEEHYPTLGIAGDYGDAGVNVGNSHGVFQVGATLNIPIFAGGKTHGDVLEAEAALRQSRQQLENLRAQIDYDVRSTMLDLQSAAEQVEVARSSVDLAKETLAQARDRFAAGVTDNLEVVQAQDSVASANEAYISSLYAHNLAKVALARATGFAEEGVRLYLQSAQQGK